MGIPVWGQESPTTAREPRALPKSTHFRTSGDREIRRCPIPEGSRKLAGCASPDPYTQIRDGRTKEGRCMIAHVHEGTMKRGFLTSLVPHGHRRTRSAAPWASGASASGTVSRFVYRIRARATGTRATGQFRPGRAADGFGSPRIATVSGAPAGARIHWVPASGGSRHRQISPAPAGAMRKHSANP